MLSIVHPELGNLAPEVTTVAPFNPLNWLRCPGNLAKLQRVARRKYRRDCEGRGADKTAIHAAETLRKLPRKYRAAAADMAVDAAVSRFIDADYAALGITDDEPARAALAAIAYVRKARWRYGMDGSSRRDSRDVTPYSGSAAARGDNPAAVAAAVEASRGWRRFDTPLQADVFENTARYALTGGGVERKTGETVRCDGGNGYRVTREMVATERVSAYVPGDGCQDWQGPAGPVSVPFRYRHVEYDGGWRMIETRQTKPQAYPAGDALVTVDEPCVPAPPPAPTAPARGIQATDGTETTRKPMPGWMLRRMAAGWDMIGH